MLPISVSIFVAFLAVVFVVSGYAVGCDPLWIFSGPRVWLLDFQGEVKTSRKRIDRNGIAWAYVYPASKIGHVILLPDGSTSGESDYIERWSATPIRSGGIERQNARFAKAGA